MQKLDYKLEFEKVQEKTGIYPVIIVEAGSSSRMKGIDKQFADLGGIPVLARTMRAFENCSAISEITIVTREEKIPDIKRLAERYAVGKLKNVLPGGNCREESVKNAMLLYKDKEEKILVHDGARPLVSDRIITDVVNELKTFDSVSCAVMAKDTIKSIDDKGVVTRTLNREELVCVQTPQGVNVNAFLKVCEEVTDLSIFTDDTSVMEYAGFKTKTTKGDYNNIKITTPEDIEVAEMLIRKEW